MSELFASKVVDIALNEVGYLEKETNSQLDSKTANAGDENWTKYARDLDKITNFYNGKKNGYDWCDMFVDWCFVTAFGREKGQELLCQPDKSTGAGCTYSSKFYKNKGQFYNTPRYGDQIFFGSEGNVYHTGLVVHVDSVYVHTVEGNTIEGGREGVFKKKYRLDSSGIYGYGRPKYDPEPIENDIVKSDDVDVTYMVKTQKHGWLGEITNYDYNDKENGFAGWENSPIIGVAMKVNVGRIKYRVHVKGGQWLGWIEKCDLNDYYNGYAGNDKPIDAIQIYYYTPDGMSLKEAVYKVNDFGWQHDTDTSNEMDGYAGLFGVNVTELRVCIKDCD